VSLFGWSLPPGCGSLPDEEDRPCEVCGLFEDRCICSPCPQCEETGRHECYTPKEAGGCGCVKSEAQIASLAREVARWEADARAEYEAEIRADNTDSAQH
jgi:hypothetical protein